MTSRTMPPAIHRVMLAQAFSKLGDNFTEVALAVFILKLTHNVSALGLVLAMAFLPRMILGPILIGLIERLPKRPVLFISDWLRAGLVFSIPLVHEYGYTVGAMFAIFTLALVYQPVLGGIQLQIAGTAATLQQALARRETYYGIADISAYLIAGALILTAGTTPAFFINALTFVAAGLVILTLPVSPTVWQTLTTRERFVPQIRQAVRFIRQESLVLFLVILSGFLNVAVGAINTVLTPLSPDLWHVSTAHYAWLVLAMAVGLMIGGVTVERWSISPHRAIALGLGLTGLGLGATLLMPNWVLGLIPLAVSGFGNAFFGFSLAYLTQSATPQTVRTRVLTLRSTIMGAGGALGAYGSGWLAHHLNLTVAVGSVSALWLALALVCVIHPALRRPAAAATEVR